MNLIEKAKLTRQEIINIHGGLSASDVADAATAKALWAIADWLEEYSENLDVFERNGVDGAAGALRRLAKEAGMTEPKP